MPPLDLAIDPAAPTERAVLDRLLQLYLHDFSEFAGPASPHGLVDAAGRFDYVWLDLYWREPGRIPLLVRIDGHLGGFVLLNRFSVLGRPADHVVAEFFVMRKYRHSGVGRRVASSVFARYPGSWEVAVAGYNRPAQEFWRRVVAEPALAPVEERLENGPHWHGPVFRFRS
jgi:predicted acetyltransferase